MNWLYTTLCCIALVLYGLHGIIGFDLFSDGDREELPVSIRQTPGGYRTYTYSNSGYQGGK